MNTLETTLEKVGRVLSDEYGIRLVCQGNRCCTNGKTIFLPALPDDIPDSLRDAIRGFCDHEVGHILGKSSFVVGAEFTKKYGPTAFGLLNCLEDLRIERVMRDRFPGSASNLSHAYRHAANGAAEQVERGEPLPFMKQLAFAICSRGQGDPDFPFVDLAVYAVAGLIEREIRESVTAPNTQTVAKLAEAAWTVVESYWKSMPSIPGDASNQHGIPGTSTPSTGSVGPHGTPAPFDVGNTPPPSGRRRKKQLSSANEQTSIALAQAPAQQDRAMASATPGNATTTGTTIEPGVIGGLGSDIATSVARYADITKAYRVWSREHDKITTPAIDTSQSHAERMAPLMRHVAGVRQKLVLSLMAEERVRWLPDQESGRLSPRALHRIACRRPPDKEGDEPRLRVFRQRVVAKRLKTAVTLLVDLSHSMNGKKLFIARESAMILCESLAQLNIPVAVWGFSTEHHGKLLKETALATGIPAAELEKQYRFAPLIHERFKGLNEPFRKISGRFTHMHTHLMTPLGESMPFAARELALRNEPRKILMVLTDGRPTVGLDSDEPTFRHAKDSIVRIEKAGVEVLLVGILESCVRDLHHRSVVVDSLEHLTGTVMNQLRQLLTRAGGNIPDRRFRKTA